LVFQTIGLLIVLLSCGTALEAAVAHTFQFDSRQLPEKPGSVHVAGSFNGWSRDATAMNDPDGDGVYTATVSLNEGVVHYKFVVNGDRWVNDPKSDKELEIDDGYGGKNSAVMIGPDIRKAPPPKANHVNTDYVRHDPEDVADLSAYDDRRDRIRVRVLAGDVSAVKIIERIPPRGASVETLYKLYSEGGYDVFVGIFALEDRLVGHDRQPAEYIIELIDGSARVGVAADWSGRLSEERPNPPPTFFKKPERERIVVPDWAKHAVWYQIFAERFRNGDSSNDPGEKDYEHLVKWTADWWKTQAGEAPGSENFYKGAGNVWKRRYGGDIKGVRWALPYLRSLGVNAIYFNPVFEADSMHKYDTSDFRHIDDNFGVKGDLPIEGETDDPSTWKWSKSDQVFLDFVAEAHRMGFKVIIDGVFNHVGRSHPFFQDVVKNGKNSKYADWFEIEDFGSKTPADSAMFGKDGGMKYKAWDGPSGHLPVFKKDPKLGLAPGPREHVLAITRRWLAPDGDPSKGIDGWRLDVPGDIPHPFWIEFRKVVKQTKPDAYITGEIWDWAQAWLGGDQFDAVMNYRFATACQDFFVNQSKAITPTQFNQRLNEMIFAYPFQVVLVQQNLFDSHDTDRLASMFVNPDLPYDGGNRIQDNGPGYKPDKPNALQWARMKQAVAFQMSFAGAPMIYYGNEAGMWSPDDPSNRQPMVWKDLEPYENPQVKFSQDVFDAHQRAIAARHTLPALRTGFYRAIELDDAAGVIAFAREVNDEHVYVALNRSGEARTVELPVSSKEARLVNWLDPAEAELVATDEITARPVLKSIRSSGHVVRDGLVRIALPPYGMAVLSKER
jgi:glycosidase